MYITNIISGFGQAIIWVAQGEYISLCATEETKGFFFALFWAFYMASQIFGNFAGAIIITRASGPIFFLIMGLIMLLSVTGYIFVKHPKEDEIKFVKNDDNEEEQLVVGHHQEHQESFMQILKNTITLIFTPKMTKCNMQLIFTGVSIAYWSGMITPIIIYQLENDPRYADLELDENQKD